MIELTRIDGRVETKVWINPFKVCWVEPNDNGSTIEFENTTLEVLEAPKDIASLMLTAMGMVAGS